MSRARQSATQAQQMLLLQQFKKLNPTASDLQQIPGYQEMSQCLAPLGSSFTVPLSANFSNVTLPEKTWGATAVFSLHHAFSEFDLRRSQDTISGKLMSDFSARLGQGPEFKCENGKSDVMYLNCLPGRQSHDTTPWKPYLGDGTVKVVRPQNSLESFLVVDVPSLPNAAQAYETVFPSTSKKHSMDTVAAHSVNTVLERTAIRNACLVAKHFADVSGIKFATTQADHYSSDAQRPQLPVPFAVSVDRPFTYTQAQDRAMIRVASGLRWVATTMPTRLVASPSPTATFMAETLSYESENVPAYFTRKRNSNVISNSLPIFYRENVFHVGKSERPTHDLLLSIVPDVDESSYKDYTQKSCVTQMNRFATAALFKV